MKLLTYTVREDHGFAPNPFFRWCTLAACTPNHRRARLEPGDWIAGHSDVKDGNRLLYAMQISEVIDLDTYAKDPRFRSKIPRRGGSWRNARGDNIYFRDRSGKRQRREESPFHTDRKVQEQDQRGDRVFVSRVFWYFGGNARSFPRDLDKLIWTRQGFKSSSHDPALIESFVRWVRTLPPGVQGKPRDLVRKTDESVTCEADQTCGRQLRGGSSRRRPAMASKWRS